MTHSTNERGVRHNVNAMHQGPTFGETAASGPAPTTAGPHRHDIINKLDPTVDSTHDHQPVQTQAAPDGTYGPHSSRLANALDPRVDSKHPGGGQAGYPAQTGAGGYGAAPGAQARVADYGTGGAYGAGAPTMHGANRQGANVPEGTYGPHHSRAANALDPKVDSDLDRGVGVGRTTAGHHGIGGVGNTHQAQAYGQGGVTTTATGAQVISGPGPASKTAGPHKSNLLNKLDPAVDSKAGGAGTVIGGGTGARY
ncbi:hypothetical protein B0T19DRAFT_295057 [Cercophora scortea]|uniref:Uncharacterized protein n=1 Tax=Cercophora scortea TaxID=314031 RepID=A0AAE0M4I6_9PEZI|nr:hypothetical protein B0T19DRAFT_295057 [Cercophora scortea]